MPTSCSHVNLHIKNSNDILMIRLKDLPLKSEIGEFVRQLFAREVKI